MGGRRRLRMAYYPDRGREWVVHVVRAGMGPVRRHTGAHHTIGHVTGWNELTLSQQLSNQRLSKLKQIHHNSVITEIYHDSVITERHDDSVITKIYHDSVITERYHDSIIML